jgi:putative adenylate-forming enzyme
VIYAIRRKACAWSAAGANAAHSFVGAARERGTLREEAGRMDARLILDILWKRRQLRSHERWSPSKLAVFQAVRLAKLRHHAYASSPFYQRLHRGLESRALADLPVVTKADLMGSFDQLVTVPGIRRVDVEAHLQGLEGNERFLGRFWVSRTSGSTGHPGIFLSDREEWATTIASYGRAQEWAGIDASLFRRTRLGVVSSRVPWHQSARVAMSVDSPFIPVRRFDATQPLDEIVNGLNAWQPENLIAYASMARVLAEEQLAGRLRISPRAVMCSSEVLTEETAQRIERAWGARPFNVYAATETAGVASECRLHQMHLFEDLVIPEAVDEHNRPVPAGTPGAKILVTVLFSRTQPLIRYEMSDCVSLSPSACPCGLPFRVVNAIDGRTEDALALRGAAGNEVIVRPNVFHKVLEPLPLKEWQVIQEPDVLRILLAHPAASVDATQVAAALTSALRATGAEPPRILVEIVEGVTRTKLGKAPLIRGLHRSPAENHS